MATTLVRIQQRRKTAAAWTSSAEVLLPAELGVETDTGKFKVGDGVTAWGSLAYAVPTGLAPTGTAGGDLTGNYPNPALAATGTAGTYGDGTHVPVITTDAKGRVTAVTPTAITGAAPSGTAGGDLTGSYPNPALASTGTAGTYGSATAIPVITTDGKGRVTSVTTATPTATDSGALQKTANLSDLASAATARTNLGLKSGALVAITVSTTAPSSPATNDIWIDLS